MDRPRIRSAFSRPPAALSGNRPARYRTIGRTLAGAALGLLMLALIGWGREWPQIVMTSVVTRSGGMLRDTYWSLSSGLRDVMASVHSCSFYLGQAAGPIAHGFARLHPDKSPGLIVGAAILVAVAYAFARARWRKRMRHRL